MISLAVNSKAYSSIRWNIFQPRNEVHAAPWMNLENVTLSARSQAHKAMCCMIPFT